jgi:hypothetical protein
MKYKIIFIDEEKDQHERFQKYFRNLNDKAEIVCLFPKEEVESMIVEIDENHPDAIVSDFLLNEYKMDIDYNVSYNGASLVEEYQKRNPFFPCFVLTSYDMDAVNISNDVNIVYVKNLLNDTAKGVKFSDRIFQQIEHYRKKITDAQLELNELIKKRQTCEAGLNDEQRLIELDAFIEQSLGLKTSVPKDMKSLSVIQTLDELITKTDKIINQFEK